MVVIGAGVVGLAIARRLARSGKSVVVIERQSTYGRGTSSRNSGVIHAGLYYPPGSLKSRLCVAGRRALYAYCEARGVPHERTGKLILAADEGELAALAALHRNARAAGVDDLEAWEADRLRREEPLLRATKALYSPSSGVVDVHELMRTLSADAREAGAEFSFGHAVSSLHERPGGWLVRSRGPDGATQEGCAERVVNAAGLAASFVAEMSGLDTEALGLVQRPCKGQYFALTPDAPRPQHALVYPLPAAGGLGVHLTRDLGGRVRAGPDATYVERFDDVAVDAANAGAFAHAVRRYLPSLETAHLTPDQAGVRPKLAGPGEAPRDFEIIDTDASSSAVRDGESAPGVIHLIGIESPGLTASLAIADEVARRI